MPKISAGIIGTGYCVPDRVLTNFDLEKMVQTSDAWIVERTGIHERRIAADDEPVSVIAQRAAEMALADAGVQAEELDLIIMATLTSDRIIPSTACVLQDRLGAKHAAAFDLSAACSGFVYAASIAAQFIESGVYRHVLVIGGETLSKVVDGEDRNTCILFGDGAGAVVLEASDTPGILATDLHADGRHVDILCVPGHVSGGHALGTPLLHMDGQAVFKLAVSLLDKTARAVLEKAGKTAADVDWLIPHQANLRIMQGTARKLGLPPEKIIVTLQEHGNTSAASIPLALDHAVRSGQVRPGQTALLEGVGGGFTWGSGLLTL